MKSQNTFGIFYGQLKLEKGHQLFFLLILDAGLQHDISNGLRKHRTHIGRFWDHFGRLSNRK